jgi:hypothetical protein
LEDFLVSEKEKLFFFVRGLYATGANFRFCAVNFFALQIDLKFSARLGFRMADRVS